MRTLRASRSSSLAFARGDGLNRAVEVNEMTLDSASYALEYDFDAQ